MRHPNTAHATDGDSPAFKKKGYALAAAVALLFAAGLTGCGDRGAEDSESLQGGQSESPGQTQEQPPQGGGSGMQQQPPEGGGSGMQQQPPEGGSGMQEPPQGGGMQPPEEG